MELFSYPRKVLNKSKQFFFKLTLKVFLIKFSYSLPCSCMISATTSYWGKKKKKLPKRRKDNIVKY